MTCDQSRDPDINFIDRIKNCACKYLREDQLATFFKFSDLVCVNLMHVNCRSLQKNFKPLLNSLHIAFCSLTAIALTETWLTPQNQDMFIINGYNFVVNSRSDRIGGGVGRCPKPKRIKSIVRQY